jgi:hypothetical protein
MATMPVDERPRVCHDHVFGCPTGGEAPVSPPVADRTMTRATADAVRTEAARDGLPDPFDDPYRYAAAVAQRKRDALRPRR